MGKKKQKQPKINKRTLRIEYLAIAPPEYAPDFDTQMRLSPGIRTENVHQYVTADLEDIGLLIPLSEDEATYIEQASVYRVLLTQALFQQIHRLPEHKKELVLEFFDGHETETDCALDIIDGCMNKAEETLNSKIFSKKIVDRVWNSIKCAYGSKHSPPNEAIFDNFSCFG